MSKTVLRVGGGEITHVKVAHKTFLSKKDHNTFLGHNLIGRDLQDYYGDDDKLTLRSEIFNLVTREVELDKLKVDIMDNCGYFEDEILTGE